MAYIPGHKHDCFLSYAPTDAAWLNALQEQLTERMHHRLGYECEMWQTNKIRTGQDFPAALEDAIRGSTAFLAILSRSYQRSDYCETELDTFLDELTRNPVDTGGYGRVLKVVRFPWLDDAHEGFLTDYQQIAFFDRDARTGQEREFKETSESFRRAVDKLSFHLEKLFQCVLRGMEKVFVARAALDVGAERGFMVREIKAAGYALSPPPLGEIRRALSRETLKQYIADASLSVHVIGSEVDLFEREQINLALESGRRIAFCLPRDAEFAAEEQRKLINDIRENRWGLRQGDWALLESPLTSVLVRDLLDMLGSRLSPSRSLRQREVSRVYLLCDPTTPDDARFAQEVQSEIQKKEDKIVVDLPQAPSGSPSPAAFHERLLRECNGLLLYHEKAPPRWVSRNFMDLITAPDFANRSPLRSRAVLLRNPEIAYPGITVIQRRDPFDLMQLEPFLAPLRMISAIPGGADASR